MQVTYESEAPTNVPQMTAEQKAVLLAEILPAIRQELQASQTDMIDRVSNAANQAMNYADTKTQEILKQIASANSSSKVMTVKFNDMPKVTLDEPVSKYLLPCVFNAKMGLNTLLYGPAGSGKTTTAKQLAKAMNLPFYSTTMTVGVTESNLFGYLNAKGESVLGTFAKPFINGGVWLGSEFDASDENTALSLNNAIANGFMTLKHTGEQFQKHKDFVCIVDANTNGKGASDLYTGRNRLDAATLDRFEMVRVEYDTDLERKLCPDNDLLLQLWEARAELLKRKSSDFLSTRRIAIAYRKKMAGMPESEIFSELLLHWGEENQDIFDTKKSKNKDEIPF